MKRNPSSTMRRAFTLVELVASMAAATALLAGMTSTMFVAIRASDPANTPAVGLLEAATCASDMSAELQYAQAISIATTTAVTVTVPDRNADGNGETIGYAWAGAGQHLTRQYNGGAPAVVLAGVHSVVMEYYPSAAAPEYLTVRIQRTADTRSIIETTLAFLNL